MPSLSAGSSPPGFLRLLVVFHEPEALGAGRSVLRAVDPLERYGWTVSGWFPGDGPLLEEAGTAIATRAYAWRRRCSSAVAIPLVPPRGGA